VAAGDEAIAEDDVAVGEGTDDDDAVAGDKAVAAGDGGTGHG
jgi:hypothetical protein